MGLLQVTHLANYEGPEVMHDRVNIARQTATHPHDEIQCGRSGRSATYSEPFYINHEHYHCRREGGIGQTHHLYKGRP